MRLLWSMCVKLPTVKSTPASRSIRSKTNCSLTTHLTPATFIMDRRITAVQAKPRWAHADSKPTSPAIDSPKPNTFSAQPTAFKTKTKTKSTIG